MNGTGRLMVTSVLSLALMSPAPESAALAQAAAGSAIDGVVTDTSLVALAGATVSILGSPMRVVTDANGRFRILVAPGSYILNVQRSSYGPASAAVQVADRDTVRVSVALQPVQTHREAAPKQAQAEPTRAEAAGCLADSLDAGPGLVRGIIRDGSTRPIGGAAVTATWPTLDERRPAQGRPVSPRGVLSRSDGSWLMCGVPVGTTITIRVAADAGADERTVVVDSAQRAAEVELVLRPRVARAADKAARATALVVLSVVDAAGQPLPAVTLDVSGDDKAVRRVVTDGSGRALVAAMESGRAFVKARHVGYQAGEVVALLGAGRNTIPIVLDPVRIPMLEAVRVIGDREVLARHQDFELRHALRQATVSITADDILKRNPADTWQMLTGISAMRVIPFGPGVFAMSNRGYRVEPKRGGGGGIQAAPCWYRLMIDGVPLPDSMPDLSRLPPPPNIHGIEVFAGPATIPPQYNSIDGGGMGLQANNTCGLIAVWTK